MFLLILRNVFGVFGRLKLAALSPNLSREAVQGFTWLLTRLHLDSPGFRRFWQILEVCRSPRWRFSIQTRRVARGAPAKRGSRVLVSGGGGWWRLVAVGECVPRARCGEQQGDERQSADQTQNGHFRRQSQSSLVPERSILRFVSLSAFLCASFPHLARGTHPPTTTTTNRHQPPPPLTSTRESLFAGAPRTTRGC